MQKLFNPLTSTPNNDLEGQQLMKMNKVLRETHTMSGGCSKAETKIFPPPQTTFTGARDGQNLISWRWSLPLPTDPVWWGLMHAILSYRSNRPTNIHTQSHTQTHRQYTAPQQCNQKESTLCGDAVPCWCGKWGVGVNFSQGNYILWQQLKTLHAIIASTSMWQLQYHYAVGVTHFCLCIILFRIWKFA